MPEKEQESVAALMDRALDDIKRTDRIFGLFLSPLSKMADGMGRLDKRIDTLEAKVDQGFERVDRKFDEVDKRFDEVDKRFNEVDRKFDKLGMEVGQVHDNVQVLMARFEQIGRYIERDERKVDQVTT